MSATPVRLTRIAHSCVLLQVGDTTILTDPFSFSAILKPDVAVPQHYTFDGGAISGRLITKADTDVGHYKTAAAQLAPSTKIEILAPGQPLDL
ncbi:MAG: hypothetical protein ACRDMX_01190 [Solirubrobacteraceae bacterium]